MFGFLRFLPRPPDTPSGGGYCVECLVLARLIKNHEAIFSMCYSLAGNAFQNENIFYVTSMWFKVSSGETELVLLNYQSNVGK